MFVGHFYPPGSGYGSRDLLNPDPICIRIRIRIHGTASAKYRYRSTRCYVNEICGQIWEGRVAIKVSDVDRVLRIVRKLKCQNIKILLSKDPQRCRIYRPNLAQHASNDNMVCRNQGINLSYRFLNLTLIKEDFENHTKRPRKLQILNYFEQ